jgi:hypothetical protein
MPAYYNSVKDINIISSLQIAYVEDALIILMDMTSLAQKNPVPID